VKRKIFSILFAVVLVVSFSLIAAPAALAWQEGPGTNWWYIDASYGGWKNSVPLVIELNGDSSGGQTFIVGDTITITGDIHSYAVMCGWENEAYTEYALEVSGPSGSDSDTGWDYDYSGSSYAEVETITTPTITYTLTAPGTHTVYMSSYAAVAFAGWDVADDYVDASLTFEVALAATPMASFDIDHAKLDFKKKADDDKVRVKGKLALDLVNGDDVDISEDVTVTVGPLTEIIPGGTMVEKGKKGEKWQYKRPKGDTGDIKKMTIDWKKGKFDIRMDKADLAGVTNPVTISVQIGDDVGSASILTREKKHHWDYKAKKHH